MALGSLVVSLALEHAAYTKGLNKADQQSLNFAKRQQKRYASIKRSAMGSVKGIVGAYAALRGVKALGRIADEYTQLTAQLKLSTRSQEEYNAAYENTKRISQSAQVEIGAVAQLYARVSNATREMGANQQSVADITEATTLALKVSGASAAEASSATLQLSQAFASGRLRGEEFNAVSEAAPRLMLALAKSLDVPVGALKEMAANGELTSDVVGNALMADLQNLREEAEQTKTIAGAFTTITNAVTLTIGEIDEATGASDAFTKTIGSGYALKTIQNFIKAVSLIFVTIKHVFQEAWVYISFVGKELAALSTGNFGDMPKILAESRKELQATRKATSDTMKAIVDASLQEGLAKQKAARLSKIKDAADEAAEKKRKAAAAQAALTSDAAARDEKKRKAEVLRELQREIEFEEDRAKTRRKLALTEAAEQARLEEDAQREKLRNINLMQRAQDLRFAEERRQVEELARIRQRDIEQYSQSITDALFRGFESGKGFVQNFKDTLINAFKTLILRPRIEAIVQGSGIGGAVNEVVGAASGGGNLFGSVKKAFELGNSSIVGSIEKLGVLISNGNGGIADKIGGFLGANAGTIGKVAPYADSIVRLFSGDVKGAAGSAVGTFIGAKLGPLGAAIGSFIGGKLFGGGRHSYNNFNSTNRYDDGQLNRTSLGTNSRGSVPLESLPAFEAVAKQFGNTLGGLLGAFGQEDAQNQKFQVKFGKQLQAVFDYELSNGVKGSIGKWVGANYGDTSDAAVKQFFDDILGEGLVGAIRASSLGEGIKSLFDGLTDQAQIANLADATIALANNQEKLVDKFGLTANQAALLAKQSGLAGDGLAKFISDLVAVADPVEDVAKQLVSFRQSIQQSIGFVPEALQSYDDFIKQINKTTTAGLASANTLLANRAGFIEYETAIKGIEGGVSQALFGLRSDDVKQSLLQEQLQSAFSEFNLTTPGSVADLIAVGEGIDVTTEAGVELAMAFPTLVEAFNNAQSAIAETQQSVESLFASLSRNDFATALDFHRAGAQVKSGVAVGGAPVVVARSSASVFSAPTTTTPVTGGGDAALLREVQALRDENKAHALALVNLTTNMERNLSDQQRFGVVLASTDRRGQPVVVNTKEVV